MEETPFNLIKTREELRNLEILQSDLRKESSNLVDRIESTGGRDKTLKKDITNFVNSILTLPHLDYVILRVVLVSRHSDIKEYISDKSLRLALYAADVGRKMKHEELFNLVTASYLQDMGLLEPNIKKIISGDKSYPKESKERAAIDNHPAYGREIAKNIGFDPIAETIYQSHGKKDGVTEDAKIIWAIDCFDSDVSKRHGKRPFGDRKSLIDSKEELGGKAISAILKYLGCIYARGECFRTNIGDVLALGAAPDGRAMGYAEKGIYDAVNGKEKRYIVDLSDSVHIQIEDEGHISGIKEKNRLITSYIRYLAERAKRS